MLNQALAYAKAHHAETLRGLTSLLQIPSISTLPEHQPDMERAARWLADKLTEIGLEHAAVMPTAGHPVVYADWLHAGPTAPTVLIYGHYDVQPVDPVDEWHTPPLEATIKGDNLYARGAADDKGQLYVHLAAVEAYLKTGGRLPLNIKFLLEGEEELGSPSLGKFVAAHLQLLQADAALISDSHIIDPATPALVTGVRGMTYMEITMRGSRQDLHSGSYGGVVANPLNVLTRVLGSLHDDQGRVTIPGFYDAVRQLTPAERQAINNGAITADSIKTHTGVPALWGESGYTPAERIGARPTLDIHGIKGGFTGKGQKTVIPAAASAKVSMRLVPDQDPNDIARRFTEHVQRICPPTVEVTIEKLSAGAGAIVDITAPAIEAAAQAYERGFGRRPLFVREGGSLPIVAMLTNELHVPVVLMGFGLPDDNLHAPNEKFYLPNFYRGIDTTIYYYQIFGGSG